MEIYLESTVGVTKWLPSLTTSRIALQALTCLYMMEHYNDVDE